MPNPASEPYGDVNAATLAARRALAVEIARIAGNMQELGWAVSSDVIERLARAHSYLWVLGREEPVVIREDADGNVEMD